MTYLRLRWEQESESSFLCHYELVISLDKNDIRREIWEDGEEVGMRTEIVTSLSPNGSTRRSMSTQPPCILGETGEYYFDAPFRDGAHAMWDSAKLGNIPVRVMALDGTLLEESEDGLIIIPSKLLT